MSWRSKLVDRLSDDTLLNNSIEGFNDYLENAVNAFDVEINHSSVIKMAIQSSSELDKSNEIMIGLTSIGDVVVVGDIVTWKDEDWIVVNKADKSIENNNKVSIQKTNNSLKFYYPPPPNENSILKEVPCVVDNRVTLNEQGTKQIKTVDNQIYVTTSNNETARLIKPNDIFKIGLNNYQVVTFPDDISQPGLLIFKLKFTEVEQTIPNTQPETPSEYTLTVDILPDSEVKLGQTKVFTAHKFNNGVEVAGALFDFTVIEGFTPSSAYTFAVLSDVQCSLKCKKYAYTVTLRATDRTDNTKYVEKIIALRSVL